MDGRLVRSAKEPQAAEIIPLGRLRSARRSDQLYPIRVTRRPNGDHHRRRQWHWRILSAPSSRTVPRSRSSTSSAKPAPHSPIPSAKVRRVHSSCPAISLTSRRCARPGRRVRLLGFHVWANVLSNDGASPLGIATVKEEHQAHGRKGSCADLADLPFAPPGRIERDLTPGFSVGAFCVAGHQSERRAPLRPNFTWGLQASGTALFRRRVRVSPDGRSRRDRWVSLS